MLKAVNPISNLDCSHCGLPVPEERQVASSSGGPMFCCGGCEFVYKTIQEYGLEDFYDLRAQSDFTVTQPPDPGARDYQFFDDPTFAQQHLHASRDNMVVVKLYIHGVHCSACLWVLERLPLMLEGVIRSELSLLDNTLRVEFDSKKIALSEIASCIDSLGYVPHPWEESKIESLEKVKSRDLLLKLGVAGICAGNTMLIAISLYQGMFSGIEDRYRDFLHWVSALLTLPVLLYSATYFFSSAFSSLRRGVLHLDLPISIGILAGFVASILGIVLGTEHVYFDSVCVLVFLLLVGRYIQHQALLRVRKKLRSAWGILPNAVTIKTDEGYTSRFRDALQVGNTVVIRSQELVACDGEVLQGNAAIDLSFLTGESRPVRVEVGQKVFAGARCISGECEVRATAIGASSRIGRLLSSAGDLGAQKTEYLHITDRLSRSFVFVVLTAAILTFFLWLPHGFSVSLANTLALLVITCPCALGLAAPLTLSAAISKAGKKGIIIRNAEAIEQASQMERIFFDKTGTLTSPDLLWGDGVIVSSGRKLTPDALCELSEERQSSLRALLKFSSHPVSKSILHGLPSVSRGGRHKTLREVHEHSGRGVSGIDEHGTRYLLGSLHWIRESGVRIPESLHEDLLRFDASGCTISAFAQNSTLVCLFVLESQLAQGVERTIETLRQMGIDLGIISGDRSGAVSKIAARLGIAGDSVHAEVLPEQKAEIIQSSGTRVAMVGDGINDAPSLSVASPGIGVAGGLESCLSVAGVFVKSGNLSDVLGFVEGARRSMKVIKQCLVVSLTYNIIGGSLAMAGFIHPLLAAILMPLSSLSVIASAVMRRTY